MKTIFKTMLAVAALAMAFACSKEEQQGTESVEPRGTIEVSIDGVIDGYTPEDTKASTETVVRLRWDGGETIYAYEGSTYLGSLTASIEGTDGLYAKLSGTITAPAQGKTVTLVYSPQFASAPEVDSDGKIKLDISDQSNADYNKVPFLVYGTTESLAAGVSNLVVNFALATSVYKVNCANLADEGAITLAKVSNVNTVCELALSDDAAPVVGGSTVGVISRNAGFRSSGDRAYVNFAVVRSDEVAANSRIIKVVKNGIRHNIAFDRGSFAPGKSYNTISKFDKFPANSIPGVFTMGGKKVVFSKGNLYWDGTSSSYKFEDHQYSYTVGEYHKWDPNHVCQFFCFRNEESARGAIPPTLPIDDRFFTETDEFSVYGMGKYFWRTMSYDEWNFCLARDNKIGMATISGSGVNVKGVVLLPDVFDNPIPHKAFVKYVFTKGNWLDNRYTTEEWEEMEAEGAVLLPFTGTRSNNNDMIEFPTGYWSSTYKNQYGNWILGIEVDSSIYLCESSHNYGYCVRMVTDLR